MKDKTFEVVEKAVVLSAEETDYHKEIKITEPKVTTVTIAQLLQELESKQTFVQSHQTIIDKMNIEIQKVQDLIDEIKTNTGIV